MLRPLVFVGKPGFPSSLMRAVQVAAAIRHPGCDASCAEDVAGIRDSVVVLVKFNLEHAAMLKTRNNIIVYDLIDTLCWRQHVLRLARFHASIDALIVANRRCLSRVEQLWPALAAKPTAVIHHHWDPRLRDYLPAATADQLVLGYVGEYHVVKHGISHAAELLQRHQIVLLDSHEGKDRTTSLMQPGNHVAASLDAKNGMHRLAALHQRAGINCHLNVRPPGSVQAWYKPGVKLATAAAFGCNLITTPDASTMELLSPAYPYLLETDTLAATSEMIAFARETFGNTIWHAALAEMSRIRTLTSIESVVAQYLTFLLPYLQRS